MNVLIDTNLLTRIANGRADPHYQLSFNALEHTRNRGHIPCLVPQVIYDFWSVATRPQTVNGLGLTPSDAAMTIATFKAPLFRLYLDERAIFEQWTHLVAQHQVRGKPSHDCRLVAAMLRHNIDCILTFNQEDFARYSGLITVVSPQNALTLL